MLTVPVNLRGGYSNSLYSLLVLDLILQSLCPLRSLRREISFLFTKLKNAKSKSVYPLVSVACSKISKSVSLAKISSRT